MKNELRHFAFEHLPPHLAAVSKPFHDLASSLVDGFPDSDQRRLALTHLLQAKDAAVRCQVDQGKSSMQIEEGQ